MVPAHAIYYAQIGLTALCCCALAYVTLRGLFLQFSQNWMASNREESPLILLFENGVLIDANGDAATLLGAKELRDTNWGHVRAILANRIASLPVALGQVDEPIRVHPNGARPGELRACLEQWRNQAKLSIYNWPTQHMRKVGIRVPVSEFEAMTSVSMDSPFPVWRMSEAGNIIWANPAFYKECGHRAAIGTTPKELAFSIPAGLKDKDTFRVSFDSVTHHALRHFDVTMIENGDTRTYFAVNADKSVQAEEARKNFIHTLSKTFAQLSTGLAIFDKDRRLVLFNPALVDQFGLSPKFLSAEPTLNEFFDALREDRMIPEPRDYSFWRERIMHMLLAAADDRYSEIWPLPSGETYRVTGRPHPNGAVAFLFEDISDELSLERRFRAQLEMMKAVIGTLKPAIAVVSPGGQFSMTNDAFQDMRRVDPDSSIANFTWTDFEAIWKIEVKESHILAMINNYLRLFHERQGWKRDVALARGEVLTVQADPVPGGYTILTFSKERQPAVVDAHKLSIG